jgi:hypothetical protein
MQEDNEYGGLESVMNEAINVLASSAGESLGDLFIGVVRGSGNNVWTPPPP